jgi:hypothetical protein
VPVPTSSGKLPTTDAIQRCHSLTRKKPRHQHPYQPGDAVYDDDVLRVVQQVAERRKLRADERAQHPKERRDLVRHVPGRGRDADEADNGAIAKLSDREREGAWALLRGWSRGRSDRGWGIVEESPLGWNGIWLYFRKVMFRNRAEQAKGDTARAGGEMGRDAGGDGAEVGTESTATVEAEPADPEEKGPQYYVCKTVEFRILWRALLSRRVLRMVEGNRRSIYAVFVGCIVNTEESRKEGLDQREDRQMEYAMGKSGCTGVDMYGGAAGKVENTPFVGPAVRAPCPSRDRIVDKGSPEEDEDEEVAGSVFPRRSPAHKRRTIESPKS